MFRAKLFIFTQRLIVLPFRDYLIGSKKSHKKELLWSLWVHMTIHGTLGGVSNGAALRTIVRSLSPSVP